MNRRASRRSRAGIILRHRAVLGRADARRGDARSLAAAEQGTTLLASNISIPPCVPFLIYGSTCWALAVHRTGAENFTARNRLQALNHLAIHRALVLRVIAGNRRC